MLGDNPGWHVSLSLPDPLCVSKEIVDNFKQSKSRLRTGFKHKLSKARGSKVCSQNHDTQLLTTLKALHVWHLQDIHQIACHLVTSLGDNPQRKKHMVPCHMHCDYGLQWAPTACAENATCNALWRKLLCNANLWKLIKAYWCSHEMSAWRHELHAYASRRKIKARCFVTECKKLPLQLSRKLKGAACIRRKGFSVCKIWSIKLPGSLPEDLLPQDMLGCPLQALLRQTLGA